MLTPGYLDACTQDIVAITGKFQDSVLREMARRILAVDMVGDATVMQAELLQQSGMLMADVTREVATLSGKTRRELTKLFQQAGTRTLEYDDTVYKEAGLNPLPISQSPGKLDLLLANARKTDRQLQNLTMTTAVSTQTEFIEAATLAQMQISSGAMDYNRAVTLALRSLGRQGVEVVYYSNGRRPKKDLVDVAVRRAALTGVNQTAAELQLMRMDEMAWDLVETTAHIGARPNHDVWQGQTFSRSGTSAIYEEFERATGYGTGAGLCGWNCRHNFFPVLPGFTTSTYSPRELDAMRNATVTVGDEEISLYSATQIQRGMEREVRALKRELVTLSQGIASAKNTGLKHATQDAFDIVAVTLKTKEKELGSFVSATGLGHQREREQVMGFGRSEASRATWATKR